MHVILPISPGLASNQRNRALNTLHVLRPYDKVCEDLILQTITSRSWQLLLSRKVDRYAITCNGPRNGHELSSTRTRLRWYSGHLIDRGHDVPNLR
jgi:hypothetical protein